MYLYQLFSNLHSSFHAVIRVYIQYTALSKENITGYLNMEENMS